MKMLNGDGNCVVLVGVKVVWCSVMKWMTRMMKLGWSQVCGGGEGEDGRRGGEGVSFLFF